MSRWLALLIAWPVSSGCATPELVSATPFHVAVVPVSIEASKNPPSLAGDATGVALGFSAEEVSRALVSALQEAFVEVTLLEPAPESDPGAPGDSAPARVDRAAAVNAWIDEARAQGADLLVDARLSYHELVHTELNDRFWLNLPLFALGGPGTWFVRDRSYFFQARMDARFHDLSSLTASSFASEPGPSDVVEVNADTTEASLSFMDRADGVGAYALSLVVPGGWVATESADVPIALRRIIADKLCGALARHVEGRALDFTRPDRVDFRPEDVRTVHDGAGLGFEGCLVLELNGQADALESVLRYRFDHGPFRETDWTGRTLERSSDGKRLLRYRFEIPIADTDATTIQLQVTQLDFDLSTRTFTYPIARNEARDHSSEDRP